MTTHTRPRAWFLLLVALACVTVTLGPLFLLAWRAAA